MGSCLKGGTCGARTRGGNPCRSRSVTGRTRCRMHGGASTGPRTPEGRARVGELALSRYVTAALADGWEFASPSCREAVIALKRSLGGSHNGTATALGVTGHAVRRVLVGLPSRYTELLQIESSALSRNDPHLLSSNGPSSEQCDPQRFPRPR
jgi:hypothetical protein